MVIYCPGRATSTHNQFLNDHADLKELKFLVLDTASADLAYASGSQNLVLCSNERYHLELHKFLTIAPAYSYIRDNWENKFDNGLGWKQRGKFLASFNNCSRPKIMRTWNDIAQYYCVLSMSAFRVSFHKWKLSGEHTPQIPDYTAIRNWSQSHRGKTIRYYRRNIYNFPTTEIDNNTVVYFHLPNSFSTYGCGYAWTKRKLESVSKELSSLAESGQRVVISMSYGVWDKKNIETEELFPTNLFCAHHYTELKAQGSVPTTEAYLVANF